MVKACSSDQFVETAGKYEGLICIGAGKRFLKVQEEFQIITEKTVYIADNDETKQHKKVALGSREIEILSISELECLAPQNMLVFITVARGYCDIIEQLEQFPNLHELDTVCMEFMPLLDIEQEVLNKKIPDTLRLTKEPLIPKVIHYCWFGKKTIPDERRQWMESWHKFCPDYEIVEWNEDNYDLQCNKFVREAYEQGKWGFVSDVVRLDVVYRYGGIYLDTDVELIRELDDLLYQRGFISFENMDRVNTGLGFGAVKGLPIIGEFLKDYENRSFENLEGKSGVDTCTMIQSKRIGKKGIIWNGEYQIVEELTVLPEKVMTGMNYNTMRTRLLPYTRGIHHYGLSWMGEETYKSREFIKKCLKYDI